jgi:hypothetical protein
MVALTMSLREYSRRQEELVMEKKHDRVLVGSVALLGLDLLPIEHEFMDMDMIATHDAFKETVQELRDEGLKISVYPASGRKMIIINHEQPETPMEIEVAWPGSTGEHFMELVKNDPRSLYDDVWAPCVEALYALKMSHRYLKDSPHFLKTRTDILWFRDVLKVPKEIDPYYATWFKRREKETYDYGHPNLSQKSSKFFSGDGIQYVWDHDTIHEAMKVFGKPAYKYFQVDEVKVDRERFNALADTIKLASVYEEAVVLALERSQIPYDFKPDPRWSFLKALEKVCTSITSGWWREFAWENYDAVLSLYTDLERYTTYPAVFHEAVDAGIIRPGKDHPTLIGTPHAHA